jgi:hypothetical protein
MIRKLSLGRYLGMSLVLAVTLATLACQGTVGPAGSTGAQGVQGPQGIAGAQGPAGPSGAAVNQAAAIHVTSQEIAHGGKFSGVGAGFIPGEAVVMSMLVDIDTVVTVGSATADALGVLEFTGPAKGLPVAVWNGWYTLQADGQYGSTTSVAVLVADAPPPVAPKPSPENNLSMATPLVCHGGVATGYGSGFNAGETVLVTLQLGDGDEFPLGGVTANDSGAFSFSSSSSKKLPDSIDPGVYTVKALGLDNSVATAAVEVSALSDGKCE